MVHDLLVTAFIFFLLVASALAALLLSRRLPARCVNEDTHLVVRRAADVFIVATSLALGMLINTAKGTFEAVDRNLHAFATELVLLDRSLRHLDAEGDEVRRRLVAYVQQALDGTWPARGEQVLDDRKAEKVLEELAAALSAIRPADPVRAELWRSAEGGMQNVMKRRWSLIDESDGTIPTAFIVLLVAWLMLIFGSIGYRSAYNAVAVSTFAAAALLIAASIYLILDMDVPFSGSIQVSPEPLQRALEQLRR
jgi:hypothetical protein